MTLTDEHGPAHVSWHVVLDREWFVSDGAFENAMTAVIGSHVDIVNGLEGRAIIDGRLETPFSHPDDRGKRVLMAKFRLERIEEDPIPERSDA